MSITINDMSDEGNTEITEFHRHELLDRISCMNVMFELISDHPAADLIRADVDEVGALLADLYQKAGAVRFP